jgi:geranylgeranyl diphosphate synthase type I
MFSQDIYQVLLGPDIDKINRHIKLVIQSSIHNTELWPLVFEATCKGRRFRPLLMKFANAETGNRWRDIIELACAIELLHKASLVHDDIVDQDSYRRGVPTIWQRFGHSEALIVGDLLIGLAFDLVSQWVNKNPTAPVGKISMIYSQTLVQAAIGEWMDLRFETIEEPGNKALEDMALMKSGALIMASIRIGAITGGACQELEQALTELGWQIGYIFQTINDLNDLNGIDAVSKRKSGSDLRLKKKNLVTQALNAAGINHHSFQLLPKNEQIMAIEPVLSELKRQVEVGKNLVKRLPEGFLKRLCASLVNGCHDTWFWLDEDGSETVMPAI